MAQDRLNVNINRQTAEALRSYAAQHDISVTESVRRFVGVAQSVLAAQEAGKELLFRSVGGVEQVVFAW